MDNENTETKGMTVYSGEVGYVIADEEKQSSKCCGTWKFWQRESRGGRRLNEESYRIPNASILMSMKRIGEHATTQLQNNNDSLESVLGQNKLLQERCEELKSKLTMETINGGTLQQVNQILLQDKRYLHQEISFLKCERKRLANVVVEQDRIARKERQQARGKHRIIQNEVEARRENEKRLEIENELYAKYFAQATRVEDLNKNLNFELCKAKKELSTVKNHMNVLQKSMDNILKLSD